MLLKIENHGPLITATNYFDLPPVPGEVCYLSTNAGAFRLLLRPGAESCLADMRTGKEVVISRGPWPAARLEDALEILFDDGTADPFRLHLDLDNVDRVPPDSDQGKEWVLSVWTRQRPGRAHKALERPCWYRRIPRIPYLKPRGE